MQTTITARHCEVTDALRERALEVTARLGQLSPQTLDATVVFDVGSDASTVEIRLHTRGRKFLVGVGEGPDHRTALDRAEDKLRPQLEKAKQAPRRPRASST